MTREEAIADIKFAEYKLEKVFPGLNEALEMAIKALEQEPIVHCKDCKHRENRVFEVDEKGFCTEICLVFGKLIFNEDEFCNYGRKESEEIVSIVEELEIDHQREIERALQEVEPNRVTPRGEVETRINGEEVKVRL